MRKYLFVFLLLSLLFCNKIENHKSLDQEDVNFIKSLNLLDKDETITSFIVRIRRKLPVIFSPTKE